MCARYSLFAEAYPMLPLPPDWEPKHNIAPSVLIPTVVWEGGKIQARYMLWGMRPSWAKSLLINARSETVLEKPAFRNAMRDRRCLIPASGFFEWQDLGTSKAPYFFHDPARPILAFAGLWRENEDHGYPEAVIMTTSPNALIAPIHDRMPCILPEGLLHEYLQNEDAKVAQFMAMAPYPSEQMASHMVTPKMGNPRFQGPEATAILG